MLDLSSRFTEVWNVDFEYRQPDDNSDVPGHFAWWPGSCTRGRSFASGEMSC